MKQIVAIIAALMASVFLLKAQESETGNWWMYFGNQKISDKLNWHNEVQYRNYNFIGDLEQLMLRTGIGYDIGENNHNILLGYGFIRSENYVGNSDEKIHFDEHRIFQQFITNQNIGRLDLSHRYRIEERFFSNDFRMRFRYFLALRYPLAAKEIKENTLYLSIYNEVFINSEKSAFDRNRLFGALGYEIKNGLRVEAGFMRQMYDFGGRNQFQIAVFNNLDFLR